MTLCTIYGLHSSRDKRIRYVGQTIRELPVRLKYHLKDAKRDDRPISRWIRKETAVGHQIIIFEIETQAVLHRAEQRLIKWYRKNGARLVNVTEGGEGNHGYRWTKEQLAKISQKRKGRVITPEWRANISKGSKGKQKPAGFGAKVSAGLKGRPKDPDHIRKSAEARRGSKWTDEQRARHSKRLKGRKFTSEHRANMSAAAKKAWPKRRNKTPRLGHKHSPETRAKISAAAKLRAQRRRDGELHP